MIISRFYKLLYGAIDLSNISFHLNQYEENRMKYDTILKVQYGIQRDILNNEQWGSLLSILKKNGLQKLFVNFLNKFSFPKELFQFMEEIYGVKKSTWEYLKINISNINYKFVFEICENNNNAHVTLIQMHMPMLYQIILDSCITNLVASYYEALINFINIKIKYNSENFFHKSESCDPCIEELYCYAFEDVFGIDGATSCRSAKSPQIDRILNVPAFVLGTNGGNEKMSRCFIQRGN